MRYLLVLLILVAMAIPTSADTVIWQFTDGHYWSGNPGHAGETKPAVVATAKQISPDSTAVPAVVFITSHQWSLLSWTYKIITPVDLAGKKLEITGGNLDPNNFDQCFGRFIRDTHEKWVEWKAVYDLSKGECPSFYPEDREAVLSVFRNKAFKNLSLDEHWFLQFANKVKKASGGEAGLEMATQKKELSFREMSAHFWLFNRGRITRIRLDPTEQPFSLE